MGEMRKGMAPPKVPLAKRDPRTGAEIIADLEKRFPEAMKKLAE